MNPDDHADDTLPGSFWGTRVGHALAREVHEATHPELVSNEHAAHTPLHANRKLEHVEQHQTLSTNESLAAPMDLVVECAALFRDLRFEEGIARAKRDPGWERDPHARIHVGIGLFYQRAYDAARAEYAVAASLSDSPSFQGTCAANAGAAWFEEGDFERALAEFARSVAIDPLNEFGLLGPLAVACERRDVDAVLAQAGRIRAAWPDWSARTVIHQSLAFDNSYRFVRDTPGLFERAFGVSDDSLYNG